MTRSVLLTGATGFVGSRLAQALTDRGDRVTNIPRTTPATSAQVAAAVTQAFDAAQPDIVCSLATSRPRATAAQVGAIIDAIVLLPTLLIHECVERGIPIVVTASYMAQRGAIAPSIYSAVRAGLEPILDWAATHRALRCMTLSLTSVHGPGDPRPKLLGALLAAARSGEPIDMVAPERRIDPIHVDDVVAAYLTAIDLLAEPDTATNQRFGGSSGEPITLAELVALVEQISARPINARWGARTSSAADLVDPPVRPSWLPGWQPRHTLTETIERELQL
jgi:nucleoside-diphosphate-sugar epimerase